jgi:molybdenum cofactor guanylyltransferase
LKCITSVVEPARITGLILAGGQGSRLGGLDKGLQELKGQTLTAHVVHRLRPQVGGFIISANRHLGTYQTLGWPVYADDGFEGPLSGFLMGLAQAQTPYVLTAACDTPHLPHNLAQTLAHGMQAEQADMAMAVSPHGMQPLCCLIKTTLHASLLTFLKSGQRKAALWATQQRCAQVLFDDEAAFFNINTAVDLAQAQSITPCT